VDATGRTLRSVVLTLAVIAAFALALARLRRVRRPQFVVHHRYAAGVIEFGRVVLARRGEVVDARAAHALESIGATVTCRGREVLSRLGRDPLRVLAADENGILVAARVRSAPERVVRIRATDCSVRWAARVEDFALPSGTP